MSTAPHEMLAELRVQKGKDQMAVFAEALVETSQAAHYSALPQIASAYMLGRVDALRPDAVECNGSAGPMAEAVLASRHLLDAKYSPNADLPF